LDGEVSHDFSHVYLSLPGRRNSLAAAAVIRVEPGIVREFSHLAPDQRDLGDRSGPSSPMNSTGPPGMGA